MFNLYFVLKNGDNSLGGCMGPLATESIDSSNGVMYIFYDSDTTY